MQHATTWFEIPVRDLAAAQRFYEALLGRAMCAETMGGEVLAVFAYDQPGVGGCLMLRPQDAGARGGSIVYLDSTPSVQAALDRGAAAGAAVVTPRTLIAPGIGYFALLRDLDGNLVGLHAAE